VLGASQVGDGLSEDAVLIQKVDRRQFVGDAVVMGAAVGFEHLRRGGVSTRFWLLGNNRASCALCLFCVPVSGSSLTEECEPSINHKINHVIRGIHAELFAEPIHCQVSRCHGVE